MGKHKGDAETVHAMASELRIVVGKLTGRLREQAQVGEFTFSQIKILVRLEAEGPATVTTLAREEGVRSQSMGEMVASLKAAGLISGAPDPSDGRQTVLSLTDACRELFKQTRAAKDDWLFHAIQTRFASDELAQLADSIATLKRLLGD